MNLEILNLLLNAAVIALIVLGYLWVKKNIQVDRLEQIQQAVAYAFRLLEELEIDDDVESLFQAAYTYLEERGLDIDEDVIMAVIKYLYGELTDPDE